MNDQCKKKKCIEFSIHGTNTWSTCVAWVNIKIDVLLLNIANKTKSYWGSFKWDNNLSNHMAIRH